MRAAADLHAHAHELLAKARGVSGRGLAGGELGVDGHGLQIDLKARGAGFGDALLLHQRGHALAAPELLQIHKHHHAVQAEGDVIHVLPPEVVKHAVGDGEPAPPDQAVPVQVRGIAAVGVELGLGVEDEQRGIISAAQAQGGRGGPLPPVDEVGDGRAVVGVPHLEHVDGPNLGAQDLAAGKMQLVINRVNACQRIIGQVVMDVPVDEEQGAVGRDDQLVILRRGQRARKVGIVAVGFAFDAGKRPRHLVALQHDALVIGVEEIRVVLSLLLAGLLGIDQDHDGLDGHLHIIAAGQILRIAGGDRHARDVVAHLDGRVLHELAVLKIADRRALGIELGAEAESLARIGAFLVGDNQLLALLLDGEHRLFAEGKGRSGIGGKDRPGLDAGEGAEGDDVAVLEAGDGTFAAAQKRNAGAGHPGVRHLLLLVRDDVLHAQGIAGIGIKGDGAKGGGLEVGDFGQSVGAGRAVVDDGGIGVPVAEDHHVRSAQRLGAPQRHPAVPAGRGAERFRASQLENDPRAGHGVVLVVRHGDDGGLCRAAGQRGAAGEAEVGALAHADRAAARGAGRIQRARAAHRQAGAVSHHQRAHGVGALERERDRGARADAHLAAGEGARQGELDAHAVGHKDSAGRSALADQAVVPAPVKRHVLRPERNRGALLVLHGSQKQPAVPDHALIVIAVLRRGQGRVDRMKVPLKIQRRHAAALILGGQRRLHLAARHLGAPPCRGRVARRGADHDRPLRRKRRSGERFDIQPARAGNGIRA